MSRDCTVIVDVGKTNAKASLWDSCGALIAKRSRANVAAATTAYRALDVEGIAAWLMESLREFARAGHVARIVPVAHGAAAALLAGESLLCAPMDYEDEPSSATRDEYARERDPFAATGSPLLPNGLNLGIQLHRLEKIYGRFAENVRIVPWPQYWAWRLCGVAASELTSLGCHSDLWRPVACEFSDLAVRRGWAARMAPLRAAGDVLAPITSAVRSQTGLPADCVVLCGMHDSNAALLAARGHREVADCDATMLSTGTWFVAMRSLPAEASIDVTTLSESRDCLMNVDVRGRAVPSARFMGGRETELLGGGDSSALRTDCDPAKAMARLQASIEAGAIAYPTFAPGVGPFPRAVGEWQCRPSDPHDRAAIASLYLALMTDSTLDLIASRNRLVVEGRFAEDAVFVRALASLRPHQAVFVADTHTDLAYGALRLVDPALQPPSRLTSVAPLGLDLAAYTARWRARARASLTS